MLRIYKLPELRRYSAGVNSKAFIFDTCIVLLLIVIPILIAHYSYDFYLRDYTYPESPYVNFERDWFLFMQTEQGNSYTSPRPWNVKTAQYIRSSIRFRQSRGSNGLGEAVHLTIQVPLKAGQRILGIALMLAFQVELHRCTKINAHIPVLTTLIAPMQVGSVDFIGDLTIQQTDILPTIGEKKILRKKYENVEINSLRDILSTFSQPEKNKVTGYISKSFVHWNAPEPSSSVFSVNATIKYRKSQLTVRPGFWFTLKFAFLQYLSIGLIFIYVAEKLRQFVYSEQLVRTTVTSTLSAAKKFGKMQ